MEAAIHIFIAAMMDGRLHCLLYQVCASYLDLVRRRQLALGHRQIQAAGMNYRVAKTVNERHHLKYTCCAKY
jgi:hypothetical protein